MVVPRKLFRCPNSCSVATVMETLVAVMIVPMNQCAIKFRAAHGGKAVERTVEQRAAHQRHQNADTGDKRCDGACAQQLLQVGAKAGREHKQYHADLSEGGNGIVGLHQIQKAGIQQQAGDDLADYLRCPALAGYKTKEFST